MVICSTCKKEVTDIRPQIEGVGVCVDCADMPLTKEAIDKWAKIRASEVKMTDEDKRQFRTVPKIWLTGQGVLDGNMKETLFNVTLHNIPIGLRIYPDVGQTHITLTREELVMLRDAIDEKIKKRGLTDKDMYSSPEDIGRQG